MTDSSAADLDVFEAHRPLLVAHAYRMLGDLGLAEDMVQNAWLRWSSRQADVQSPRAYLLTLVTRLCINELDSARMRREESRGDRLPEPVDLDDSGIGRMEAFERILDGVPRRAPAPHARRARRAAPSRGLRVRVPGDCGAGRQERARVPKAPGAGAAARGGGEAAVRGVSGGTWAPARRVHRGRIGGEHRRARRDARRGRGDGDRRRRRRAARRRSFATSRRRSRGHGSIAAFVAATSRSTISTPKCTSSTASRRSSSTTRTSRSLPCCSPSPTTASTVSSSTPTWSGFGIWGRALMAKNGFSRSRTRKVVTVPWSRLTGRSRLVTARSGGFVSTDDGAVHAVVYRPAT